MRRAQRQDRRPLAVLEFEVGKNTSQVSQALSSSVYSIPEPHPPWTQLRNFATRLRRTTASCRKARASCFASSLPARVMRRAGFVAVVAAPPWATAAQLPNFVHGKCQRGALPGGGESAQVQRSRSCCDGHSQSWHLGKLILFYAPASNEANCASTTRAGCTGWHLGDQGEIGSGGAREGPDD